MGGQDGVSIITRGILNISNTGGEMLTNVQVEKIVGGLLSVIEIWMTDLCMEPNAEEQCEELIQKAMELTEENLLKHGLPWVLSKSRNKNLEKLMKHSHKPGISLS